MNWMKMNVIRCLVIVVGLLPQVVCSAKPLVAEDVDGYTFAPEEERYQRVIELSLTPKPEEGPPLRELIFDSELNREFTQRYEQSFGRSSVERNFSSPNRFDPQEYQVGVLVSVQEDQSRRRTYGDYLIKRLAEHHVDNYVKSNPAVRPVYELKERISHVNMEVKKGYKLKINYSYSGNYLNFSLENPFDIETNLTLEMDPEDIGPSDITEARLHLMYPIKPGVRLASDIGLEEGSWSVAGYKTLNSNVTASLTGARNTNYESLGLVDERILVGISWSN